MLSLIAAGSKGCTLGQLLSLLRSKSISDLNLLSSKIINLAYPAAENLVGGPLLSFVNGAWFQQEFSLKPSFDEIVKGFYKAQLKTVDFVTKGEEVVEEVNSWAEAETKGQIKQLIPPGSFNEDTVLVLANALYFKGAWNQRFFDPSMTQLRDFHLLNGQIVRVPFMTTQRFIHYGSVDGYKVVQIPYQSGQDPRKFSMYFFLPNEKDGLHSLIQNLKLNPGFLNQRFMLRLEEIPHFWIPKFKFSFEFEASKTMKEMGLTLPFKPGELTEMVDNPSINGKLYVSSVFHKSRIEVNEEGTEAAASTAVIVRQQCARINIPTPSFVADHPFMFMIREETHGMVFFVGAVLNPLLHA